MTQEVQDAIERVREGLEWAWNDGDDNRMPALDLITTTLSEQEAELAEWKRKWQMEFNTYMACDKEKHRLEHENAEQEAELERATASAKLARQSADMWEREAWKARAELEGWRSGEAADELMKMRRELERYRADLYQLAGWPNDEAEQMREFARQERAALTHDLPEEGR